MNFNLDEYGQTISINLGEDISSGTDYTVELEPQFGKLKTFTSNIALGTSNIDYDDQSFLANEYLNYTVQIDDIDAPGQWRVRASSIVAGELIKSDYVRFTVLP